MSEAEAQTGPSSYLHAVAGLDPDSYTATRLQHATPEHLHLTTRRCFVGPIPEGWLKSHRERWYRHHISLANYSSRAATFSAGSNVSYQRRVTGLDGPSSSAIYGHSFPQPDDASDPSSDDDVEVTVDEPPAQPIPRSTDADPDSSEQDTNPAFDNGPSSIPLDSDTTDEGDSTDRPGLPPSTPSASSNKRLSTSKSLGSASFVTAHEAPEPVEGEGDTSAELAGQAREDPKESSGLQYSLKPKEKRSAASTIQSSTGMRNSLNGEMPTDAEASASTASLISHKRTKPKKTVRFGEDSISESSKASKRMLAKMSKPSKSAVQVEPEPQTVPAKVSAKSKRTRGLASNLVRFKLPDEIGRNEHQAKMRMASVAKKRPIHRHRHARKHNGEIVKLEKMLVRIESTQRELPNDYDENDSMKTESRIIEKWKEFVVVCREKDDQNADLFLQIYQSRVIPAVDRAQAKKRPKFEIPLNRKTTRVNLYSSLDKTLVMWLPGSTGTMIYIMRPRSAANSVEWYTFLRAALGRHRSSHLQVNVPDLSITLRLYNPFESLESSKDAAQAAEGDESAIMRTMMQERAVAGSIIEKCMEMLKTSPEWADVFDAWTKYEKMGLAWRRYDRLEWVHGVHEQKIYGAIAMQKSHELELRPKHHYPTTASKKDRTHLKEPASVEGFLIRLTSQKGMHQRFGRLFYKRLYFSTHDQFLCFCRPSKAHPPPPPTLPMREDSKIPSAHQIVEKIPLIYAVNPYPLEDGHLSWAKSRSAEERKHRDRDACDEAQRRADTVLNCEGYINLCDVLGVRDVVRGSTPADQNVRQGDGDDVDFHETVPDTLRDDGNTTKLDDDRTFELAMRNNLVIRLQAFDAETKKEWMTRLDDLVEYWRLRIAADMAELKTVRQANLKQLNIDEDMEAVVGQYARKWEITSSVASPQLYNMCGITGCRAISISGTLYRKPSRRSTFIRCGVILCQGQLLIFQDALRKTTGKELPQIHHERQATVDLKDCYIYSGLITENDLLYQNQTFDNSQPGQHALPRIYRDDGWTSKDDDAMTCFVLWHVTKKALFRAPNEAAPGRGDGGKLRLKSRLGVPGRALLFKTRSRAERDHWVMNISNEIERVQQGEDIRIEQA
ncbi:MAG: hypothetical protein M1819_003434 [Sarea resinae]|nr:MAG: hypothetical protein M1819_003434 [Sarea resinae]